MNNFRQQYKNANFELVKIGNSNRDLYKIYFDGILYPLLVSIAKRGSGASDSFFGTKQYSEKYFNWL